MAADQREKLKAIRRLNRELGIAANPGATGILLGAGVIAILGVGALALVAPLGPRTSEEGRIETLSLVVREDRPPRLRARVQAHDRIAMISLPPTSRCRPGDRIRLLRSRTFLATHLVAQINPCG